MTATDWRGVPINVGDTVVYSATSGSSAVTVEGTVVGFTDKGSLTIQVIRRMGGGEKPRVSVGPKSCTVVAELPQATVPTMHESLISTIKNRVNYYQGIINDIDTGNYKPKPYEMQDPMVARSNYQKYLDKAENDLIKLENAL